MTLQAAPVKAGAREQFGVRLMAVAVVSTILASTCCVLPLLLVLAGVTGAWMTSLVALKPVTPYFTVLALTAIGWAGYLVFKRAPECADDAACDVARPLTKRVFIGCALFVALLLSFPLFAPLFY